MRVSEIFLSLQGEGRMQGRPTTFVRLTGCNLRCVWCDTKYAQEGGDEMAEEEILSEVEELGCHHLCITGGEPLVQGKTLLPLLTKLSTAGYSIEIETNGTFDFRAFQPYASICMDMKCPSSGEESNASLLPYLHDVDSVKFVIADEKDFRYAEKIIISAPFLKCEIFISPVEGSDYAAIADLLVEAMLPARFQLQVHKIVGVK